MDDENRKKLSKEERLEQREQKLAFSKHMYAMTMAYLQKHLKHLTTEGRGDCWLLAIMADFEVTDHEPLKANPEPEAAHRDLHQEARRHRPVGCRQGPQRRLQVSLRDVRHFFQRGRRRRGGVEECREDGGEEPLGATRSTTAKDQERRT